ncbi:MAG: signal peptidase I [Phocaeicola sp.]
MKNSLLQIIKALVGAVLLVLLTKAFVFVSCTIPSTGMENSLYQGEKVLVNKWSYGLRLPFSTYRVRKQQVDKGDVVLFNNPHPAQLSTNVFLREPFISRCVGLPGDTLMLNEELWAVAEHLYLPHSKALYLYSALKEDTIQFLLNELGINDNPLVGYSDGNHIRSLSRNEYYDIQQRLPSHISLSLLYKEDDKQNRSLILPRKGVSLAIDSCNAMLYCNTIKRHENKDAFIKNDTLFVSGSPVTRYVFTKDYYWMASNNPINLCDSRLFGLVPEDHLIGKAWLIWYTSHKERLFQRLD